MIKIQEIFRYLFLFQLFLVFYIGAEVRAQEQSPHPGENDEYQPTPEQKSKIEILRKYAEVAKSIDTCTFEAISRHNRRILKDRIHNILSWMGDVSLLNVCVQDHYEVLSSYEVSADLRKKASEVDKLVEGVAACNGVEEVYRYVKNIDKILKSENEQCGVKNNANGFDFSAEGYKVRPENGTGGVPRLPGGEKRSNCQKGQEYTVVAEGGLNVRENPFYLKDEYARRSGVLGAIAQDERVKILMIYKDMVKIRAETPQLTKIEGWVFDRFLSCNKRN